MKIDVMRPPAPTRPPAEVIIVLTEQEAINIRRSLGNVAYGALSSFYIGLSAAVDTL